MKDFFHSTGFKLLLGVVFVLFGVLLYTASAGGSAISDLLGLVTAPMQKVSTVISNNAAVAAEDATRSREQLIAENQQLRRQIDELHTQLIDYYQLKLENEQFRSVLELKNDNQDFQFVSAAVIGRDPNDVFYTFQIDKGSSAGISVNDPVITNSGVAGWISSVTTSYARVTTILSADTSISALDKVNRQTGVISSNIEFAEQGVIKMGYLPSRDAVQEGDIVVTSGLGGLYPRNLPIGKVLEVFPEESDVTYYATVEPLVDVKTVRDVFVITDFEGQGEVLDDLDAASAGEEE